MARQPGVSKSTFYREWRKAREGQVPDVVFDLSFPNVIERSELENVLEAERAARERQHERRHAGTRINPNYDDLRAAGKSDLRARRESRGISLDDLSAASGVPKPHLAQLENGTRQVSDEQRAAIMSALGVGNTE